MKKVRVVNRRRFTRSISLILVVIMTLSLLAFVSLKSEGSTEPQYVSICVETGDTLWSIASRHVSEDMDVRELIYHIEHKNQLVSSAIYPGQELQIPIQ